MDRIKALEWEQDLKGRVIGACEVTSLIDFGKSAAVFEARRHGDRVAIKIFDDELIERYGDEQQLQRIERELSLIGKAHPHMVEIIDGGIDTATGNHFIVMNFLDGPNLAKSLQLIPPGNVPILIEQLASCCKYLENLGLAHRDIKPANIVLLNDFSVLKLLDFGVLKPVGEVGLTDIGGIQSFVGTLQYSSPEFLLRQEEDTQEGWRALSLYQIGGVLHDLITRKTLFAGFTEPYARLVNAVQHDTPAVQSSTTPAYLLDACRAALVKNPITRLKLVSWESFSPPLVSTIGAAARERVTRRSLIVETLAATERSNAPASPDLLEAAINLIKIETRRIRNENTTAFPPLVATRMPPDDSKVVIAFRPGDRIDLGRGVSIEIETSVLDDAAQAINIYMCAWIGTKDMRPTGNASVLVYKGLLVPASLSEMLESALYVTLDRAQNAPESHDGFLDLKDLEVAG